MPIAVETEDCGIAGISPTRSRFILYKVCDDVHRQRRKRQDISMRQIEFYYFDPISPFAYLGSIQIERLAARLGRSVVWKPVLIGITILKVMGLKPFPETPLKGPYLKHDAVRLAEYFDVPFHYHGQFHLCVLI